MKNLKIRWSLVLALGLALAGVTGLASAQWVPLATPTPTPAPIGVLNGFVHSDGKNVNGVEQSTEKGANGAENGIKDSKKFGMQ